MIKKILSPIRNYKMRSWLASVESFAKKMKKENRYFLIADEKRKEAKEMAEMMLKHLRKAKQGNETSQKIVKVCLEQSGEKGKKLAAKMP